MPNNLFDDEGFLTELSAWDESIAVSIAQTENIDLTPEHWQLINCARDYYESFNISPEMRPLVKWVTQQLGKDKGRSIYLLSLFPDSPAKLISKIAGLPKPLNCI